MHKVLVVDDSALMRKLMCDIINSIEGFSVTTLCADGESAFSHIKNNDYSAVTLNMLMPKYDGTKILKKLKEENLNVPVIAVSSSVKEDRENALKAIELGAVDFVLRPLKLGSGNMEVFSRHLEQALKIAVSGYSKSISEIDFEFKEAKPTAKAPVSVPMFRKSYDLIAIASSTGGPQALQTLLSMMPANIGVPVVVVQHMPTGFTASLADRIDHKSKLRVKEAEKGDILKPNCVYIAQGGHQMMIGEREKGVYYTNVTDDPPVNNLRPCADVMFESLMKCSFSRILCIVLTGMGSDGAKGLLSLKTKKKIHVITQDEKSCVVYGMPKAAFENGLSDAVCDIKEMAAAIAKELGVL